MRARLVVAVAASLAVVAAAPFVGQLRAAVQSAMPGRYVAVLVTAIATAVVLALVAAVWRIRERRALRYGALAAAVAIAATYATLTSSGIAEVDAVERFHFVEYGLLALLYHRVWRAHADLTAFALPLLAGILVGTVDEWVQWVIPFRVGELRDVLLNGVAVVCGLLFAIGLDPPRRFVRWRDGRSRATLFRLATATAGTCALFFHVVHLGYAVPLAAPAAGTFASRFQADELLAASHDRDVRWGGVRPVQRAVSREDQYLSEALWHIEHRNEAVTAGDARTAWHEHVILETYYPAVLRVLPEARWPAEQRAAAQTRAATGGAPYRSEAHPFPIRAWSRPAYWTVVAAVLAVLAFLGARRRAAADNGQGLAR